LIATIIIFPKCYLRLLRADSLFLQRRRLRLCHHAAHGDDDRNTNGSAHKNNWRNFSDRIIQPGDIVFMDLAALTWNGYTSCYYRTYCVGKEPTKEQKETYDTALKWLYDSIGAVKAGATTRDIALKWPSAMETWGYEDEDQAAANLWGHGLGLAQYDPPVISRIER
jgi:Xaa-Pro aminopeptidase